MTMTARQRRLEIADFVAILAGVSSIGFALYGAPITTDDAYNAPIASLWAVFLGAGVLAILGVVMAQRNRGVGRALLAVAGVLVLAGAFLTGGPWVTVRIAQAVLGVVMLAASTQIGRMTNELP